MSPGPAGTACRSSEARGTSDATTRARRSGVATGRWRRARRRRGVLLAALAVLALGCDQRPPTPTAPSRSALPPDFPWPLQRVEGVWSGTLRDDTSGAGKLRLEIPPRTGSLVTGTWAVEFGKAPPDAVTSGTFFGVFALNPVFFNLECGRPAGLVAFHGRVDRDRMLGIYVAFDCPGFDQGSFELARSSPSPGAQ